MPDTSFSPKPKCRGFGEFILCRTMFCDSIYRGQGACGPHGCSSSKKSAVACSQQIIAKAQFVGQALAVERSQSPCSWALLAWASLTVIYRLRLKLRTLPQHGCRKPKHSFGLHRRGPDFFERRARTRSKPWGQISKNSLNIPFFLTWYDL